MDGMGMTQISKGVNSLPVFPEICFSFIIKLWGKKVSLNSPSPGSRVPQLPEKKLGGDIRVLKMAEYKYNS